jgi:hypothetical protein
MGNLNFGRVILGGLVNGLVINIGEFVLNEVVFKQQMEEMAKKLNVGMPGGSFIAIAVLITFILGIVIVLTYALIRPRLGAGPKTAIVAGLICWFGIYVYSGILNSMFFGLGKHLLVIGMAWGLAEYLLGALLGGWLYKES